MEYLSFCIRAIAIFFYILPIKNIMSNFPSLKYQIFADDIQLYIDLPLIANSSDDVALIDCINMVKILFFLNSLMFNMNKTQLLNIILLMQYVILYYHIISYYPYKYIL